MIVIFLYIICYDVWNYIFHRILHHSKIYFVHRIHHNKYHEKLYYMDANNAHCIEHIIKPFGLIIPFLVINNNQCLIVSFIFVNIREYMKHDNRFCWLIGNHHLLHHKYPKYNFGEYWIDKLCGTLNLKENEYIYGIIYT